MVLPSHIPPLAWGQACAEGGGGPQARRRSRRSEPPVRLPAGTAGGLRPVCQPLAGGSGDWHLEEEGLCAFGFLGCRDTFFRKNFDFLLHFRRDLRYTG